MSRVCAICGKSKVAGNSVTFSHKGIRRTWTPNLRRVRVYDENGTPKRITVCTRCLRSGKVNRNRPQDIPFAEETEAVEAEAPAAEVSEAEASAEAVAE